MVRYILIGISLLFAAACSSEQKVAGRNIETKENIVSETSEAKKVVDETVEFFTDDSKIGQPNKNKVELSNIKKSDGNVAVVKFYSLGENKQWSLKQTFEFEKDDILDCRPEIKDFNNDGFRDLTYVSGVAARGANDVRKLFIYDKGRDELVYIKNSENYPNLRYNEELDCLDAWLFHSGTTTVFLKIKGDELKEFASVDNGLERIVYLIDENGKEKILRRDKISGDDVYVRYKNFNPLKAYEEEK